MSNGTALRMLAGILLHAVIPVAIGIVLEIVLENFSMISFLLGMMMWEGSLWISMIKHGRTVENFTRIINESTKQ